MKVIFCYILFFLSLSLIGQQSIYEGQFLEGNATYNYLSFPDHRIPNGEFKYVEKHYNTDLNSIVFKLSYNQGVPNGDFYFGTFADIKTDFLGNNLEINGSFKNGLPDKKWTYKIVKASNKQVLQIGNIEFSNGIPINKCVIKNNVLNLEGQFRNGVRDSVWVLKTYKDFDDKSGNFIYKYFYEYGFLMYATKFDNSNGKIDTILNFKNALSLIEKSECSSSYSFFNGFFGTSTDNNETIFEQNFSNRILKNYQFIYDTLHAEKETKIDSILEIHTLKLDSMNNFKDVYYDRDFYNYYFITLGNDTIFFRDRLTSSFCNLNEDFTFYELNVFYEQYIKNQLSISGKFSLPFNLLEKISDKFSLKESFLDIDYYDRITTTKLYIDKVETYDIQLRKELNKISIYEKNKIAYISLKRDSLIKKYDLNNLANHDYIDLIPIDEYFEGNFDENSVGSSEIRNLSIKKLYENCKSMEENQKVKIYVIPGQLNSNLNNYDWIYSDTFIIVGEYIYFGAVDSYHLHFQTKNYMQKEFVNEKFSKNINKEDLNGKDIYMISWN